MLDHTFYCVQFTSVGDQFDPGSSGFRDKSELFEDLAFWLSPDRPTPTLSLKVIEVPPDVPARDVTDDIVKEFVAAWVDDDLSAELVDLQLPGGEWVSDLVRARKDEMREDARLDREHEATERRRVYA